MSFHQICTGRGCVACFGQESLYGSDVGSDAGSEQKLLESLYVSLLSH